MAEQDRTTLTADYVDGLFECPVCTDTVLPPILQCVNGHLLCANCRKEVTTCPVCRCPPPDIRNLGLEKLCEKVKFPCKYKSVGCPSRLSAADKLRHQESCDFRSFRCPYPSGKCGWQGWPHEVRAHLVSLHPHVSTFQGEEMVLRVNANGADVIAYWIRLQLCFDHEFMMVLRRSYLGEGLWRFCAVMLLLGASDASDRFAYHLEFSGPDGRCAYEGMPLYISDSVAAAMDNGDCLQFEISNDKMKLCDGVLRIKSTVRDLS